jgi:hypothetical protein
MKQATSGHLVSSTLSVLVSALLGLCISAPALAKTSPEIKPASLQELAEKSDILNRAKTRGAGSNKISIAILDNGFQGFQEAQGRTLPSGTRLYPGPVAVDPKIEEFHGLKMAEVVSYLLEEAGVDFELHLYSAFGFSNLRHAIDRVIERKHDLVLYAQVWEYGGNPDGTGFINAEVRRATKAGVKWINAAGNFANGIYLDKVDRIADDWAYLPGPNSSVQVRCHRTALKKCQLRSVLSWSGFADTIQSGTEKDLDLVLTDDTLKVIKVGGLKQVKAGAGSGESLYPREIIEAELPPGLYYLRVKIRSGEFSKKDYLRITMVGDGLELLNRTEGETLLAPADLPDVITVGASDSRLSSFSRKLSKPNLRTPSLLQTEESDGDQDSSGESFVGSFLGSSTAAAVATALGAFELSHNPRLTSRELKRKLQTGGQWNESETAVSERPSPATPNSDAMPVRSHDGRQCLSTTVLMVITPEVRKLMRGGLAWSVLTDTGVKLILDQDPIEKLDGSGRLASDEILVLGVDRFGQPERFVRPISWRQNLASSPTHIEVLKLDRTIKICP